MSIKHWFFEILNIDQVKITYILAGLSLVGLFAYLFRNKNYRRSYLEYVLFLYPIIALNVTRETYGMLTVFDAVTYIVMLLTYKDIFNVYKRNIPYLVLAVIFISLLILGSLYSQFAFSSFLYTVSFIPIIFYVKMLVDECVSNPAFLKRVLLGCKFSFLIATGFMLLQLLFGPQVTIYDHLNNNVMNEGGAIRYPGMFMDSQNNSLFLGMSSIILLLNINNPSKPKLSNILFSAGAAIAILLAGGRSGFFGFCCGMTFVILFQRFNFKIGALAIILGALLILPFFSKSFIMFNRKDSVNESYAFRHTIWSQAYDIFEKHPYLGIGTGNYESYVKIYSQDQYLRQAEENILWLNQPENGYLKILVENGIFCFIIIMAFILFPVLQGLYTHLFKRKIYEVLYYVGPLIAWSLGFATVYSFGDRRILILVATLVGLILSKINSLKHVEN